MPANHKTFLYKKKRPEFSFIDKNQRRKKITGNARGTTYTAKISYS